MKQKTIKYSFAVVIILFLVYQINDKLALGLDTLFINLLPHKKLPSEFVNYKNLSEVKNFGNHHLQLLHKSEGYNSDFQAQVISNEEIIVKVITKTEHYDHGAGNNGDNLFNTIFKINSFGKVLDTISFKTSTSNQSEFGETVLLNKQIVNTALLYYQTWPTDGDKTKKNFISINKDLKWSAEKLSQYYYEDIIPNAIYLQSFIAWRDQTIPADKRLSIIYFAKNQWHILYGVDSDIFYGTKTQNQNPTNRIVSKNVFDAIPADKIIFKYFEKLDYHSILIGQTQSNSPYTSYYWDGVAYINIPFANDTLKFKRENIFIDNYGTNENSEKTKEQKSMETENELRNKYSFYSNPNLKFSLFYDDESKNLYIVQKVK